MLLQVIINTETAVETSELLNKRLFAIKNQRMGGDSEELALIIGESDRQANVTRAEMIQTEKA